MFCDVNVEISGKSYELKGVADCDVNVSANNSVFEPRAALPELLYVPEHCLTLLACVRPS